eukprot:TRINITY_DN7142_c0_g1_i1.p1 TRINITY_DN7142_c0_g1~~TRINITY_DN7142_c0_g1_i1.p1  ORF type:complete len:145 (-),score=30.53 TRINITY_DN7142_c0_g1_i1:12-446(-)
MNQDVEGDLQKVVSQSQFSNILKQINTNHPNPNEHTPNVPPNYPPKHQETWLLVERNANMAQWFEQTKSTITSTLDTISQLSSLCGGLLEEGSLIHNSLHSSRAAVRSPSPGPPPNVAQENIHPDVNQEELLDFEEGWGDTSNL